MICIQIFFIYYLWSNMILNIYLVHYDYLLYLIYHRHLSITYSWFHGETISRGGFSVQDTPLCGRCFDERGIIIIRWEEGGKYWTGMLLCKNEGEFLIKFKILDWNHFKFLSHKCNILLEVFCRLKLFSDSKICIQVKLSVLIEIRIFHRRKKLEITSRLFIGCSYLFMSLWCNKKLSQGRCCNSDHV